MIIELSVQNFRSIKEKQTFSMVKSKSNELDENYFDPEISSTGPLLCSAAIYGANAAGKSNFIKAVKAMHDIVADSAKNTQRGDKLPLTPFRLCSSTTAEPTEFEMIFVVDGIKYQYGFSATSEKIIEEWLYAFPNNKPQRWFIRAFDDTTNEYVWSFGSFLTGKKQTWKDSTRSNSLFLSAAVLLNSEQLQPVYDWFTETLHVTGINKSWGQAYTSEMCSDDEGKQNVLKFLNSADLDISDLELESKKIDVSVFPDEMPQEIKEHFVKELEGGEIIQIKTIHTNQQGDKVLFELNDESDGTNKIFSFAGPWIDTLKHGRVLFIDELHDSLHPHIVKFLTDLFHSKKTNPNNAQLIFTTHETSILDQDVFRRDQVWFCKKEKDQSTVIYPLSDFSPRKGAENLEKSYLSGRYSALPLISSFEELAGE